MQLEDVLLSDEPTYRAIGASVSTSSGYSAAGRMVCTDSRVIHKSHEGAWIDIIYEDVESIRYSRHPSQRPYKIPGGIMAALGAVAAGSGLATVFDVASIAEGSAVHATLLGVLLLACGLFALWWKSTEVEELEISAASGTYTFRSTEDGSPLQSAAEAIRMGRDAVKSAAFGKP